MKKILFCGGGSAGHVIPNVALIESLDGITENFYIGTNGIESKICAQNNIKFYECDAVKLVRGKILCNLALPFKLIKSIGEAGKILDDVKPDLVFCKGGYACVPPAIAAKKRNIPVITHESDVSAGLANKFIAKKCCKVLTTFPSTARKFSTGICTGSPMRKNLFGRDKANARAHYGLDMRPTVLVFGGGSGSKIINESLRKCAAKICKKYNILHLCGRGNALDTNIYGYKQIEFENDMGLAYACADYAISRCGSNAANELIALKIPTLFIPLQNKRTRGDQVKNAELFRDAGLCRVLYESELTPASLEQNIERLINDENLKTALEKSAVKCGNEKIVKEILNTLFNE
ncbi:MAG: UDP-N-acetylglucosamine--N-acetylmuramyl-(pentapeptide) pyrophosphoryl-undecaprenol N-acetylglucosamine transferase [Clostridiales bacterium]|nr:UDP-N-acetylglucosamine--N-acetylmuramyl-(pentapeptide) pyrophosphoryl-undecaprenol N-acetylglucosamine transferase [Clostridiales bacterium]